ncbi:MAG: hypothetical protein ACXW1B_03690 [Nitrososphaeraceae archaeon]
MSDRLKYRYLLFKEVEPILNTNMYNFEYYGKSPPTRQDLDAVTTEVAQAFGRSEPYKELRNKDLKKLTTQQRADFDILEWLKDGDLVYDTEEKRLYIYIDKTFTLNE